MILIGSHALRYHFDDYFSLPKDIDLIGTEKEFFDWTTELKLSTDDITKNKYENLIVYNFHRNGIFYEYEIADNNSAEDYLKYCEVEEGDFDIAPPEVLLSIKKSHIHKHINFHKHIFDYHFLKEMGVVDNKLEEITVKRKKETDIRLKTRYPNLNKSYDDFVSESQDILERLYDHDDLHRIVSHYDQPLYKRLQVDDTKVWCEKDLWNKFSDEDKIKCVLEEVYVIALERKIIPMVFQAKNFITHKEAVSWSLIRTATSLSSGWFSKFIIENYYKILENVKYDFVYLFFDELDKGNVKHYINSSYK